MPRPAQLLAHAHDSDAQVRRGCGELSRCLPHAHPSLTVARGHVEGTNSFGQPFLFGHGLRPRDPLCLGTACSRGVMRMHTLTTAAEDGGQMPPQKPSVAPAAFLQ
mmetsp:Transcript_70137/g.203385  ORF Transcript_70137/g.203385 Transcript_70137/m.203385 type:complete len:106 (-) Transcript_70137:171-488(-)